MKRTCVVALLALLSIAAGDSTQTPVERIQGTWVWPGSKMARFGDQWLPVESPRQVWTFDGQRFTFTRDAFVSSIVCGGAGRFGVIPSIPYPRFEMRGTFRQIGTKTPRVIVLTFEEPVGTPPHETTYELPDDSTFVYHEGWVFGRRSLLTYKREALAKD
jgi:hypothetical protein